MNVSISESNEYSTEIPLDVVLIDDEEVFSEGCRQTLELGGYRTAVAENGPQGLQIVGAMHPSVVLVDLKMPGMDGIEVISHLPEIEPSAVPIVITGHGSIDSAVESMKVGAFDFITKPFEPEKLLETVRRGMDLSTFRKESESEVQPVLEEPSPEPDKFDLLLQGLDVLGGCYSLGLDKPQILNKLTYLETEAKYHARNLGQIKKKERAILDMRNDLAAADAIMREHSFQKSALIQILLEIQEHYRWLPRHILHWIAGRLNVPLNEIYSIAEFYDAFNLEPRGRHSVQVCTGTACHVRGSTETLAQVSAVLGIRPGQTDNKQEFSLDKVHCLGCCGLAPVVQIDDKHYQKPTIKKLEKIIKSLEKKEAKPCSV